LSPAGLHVQFGTSQAGQNEGFFRHQQMAAVEFGADMQVSLVNDGPVTICYDTNQK